MDRLQEIEWWKSRSKVEGTDLTDVKLQVERDVIGQIEASMKTRLEEYTRQMNTMKAEKYSLQLENERLRSDY